ncbi:MAG TPA: DUF4432 family protein [Chloroflexota bacterium]|nr:DUF4432 family protein [Chloroflexota bacterium]
MVNVFGQELSRRELLRRVGSLDQVAGVRRVRLEDGPEDGVTVVEVRTGGGLRYTVVPSRAMDVATAEVDGVPIAWRTGAGEMHPAYLYRTNGWNVGWFGGLLATCGLDNVGSPGQDELGVFGQHGWINGVAARQVNHGGRWDGERYVMWVEGELRQKEAWMPGTFDVVLRRRIESELGSRTIRITDEAENLSEAPAPLMLLYHVNLGYPLVGPEAEIVSRARSVTPFGGGDHDPAALRVVPPGPDVRAGGHVHEVVPDADGYAEAALLNDRLGIGLALRFPVAELPSFRQWKALMNRRYVVALEPANYAGGNRVQARDRGTLQTLGPGEVRAFHLELTALRGADELAAARERMKLVG